MLSIFKYRKLTPSLLLFSHKTSMSESQSLLAEMEAMKNQGSKVRIFLLTMLNMQKIYFLSPFKFFTHHLERKVLGLMSFLSPQVMPLLETLKPFLLHKKNYDWIY